ncbi:hypothetical protein K438DRAFT_994045 [Mycena galopus ATCC 62051]|nr:hypothetical protein K438DRAFT_994045 [Mycena galopus ATCC 62051]
MAAAAVLRAQILDISLAISRQHKVLDDLLSRRWDLQTQLDSIAYPVLSLPPEITSEIFTQCLPTERDLDVVNAYEAPLLLTHVCRAWRQIAIALPALWTTFDVQNVHDVSHLSEIVQTWFERAQKCPLTVRIHGSLSDNNNASGFMQPFRRHSRQIRSLELEMDEQDFDYMGSPQVLDLPLLQKLSIRIIHDGEDAELETPQVFNNVPLLHEVVMNGVLPSLVILPWQQLRKFTGKFYSVEDSLEALRIMPSLTECSLSGWELEVDDGDQFEAVSHPNLQHLTLLGTTADEDEDMGGSNVHILTHITLPCLQTLEICDQNGFDSDEFDSFLERSSAPLRKLAVGVDFEDGGTELAITSFLALGGLTELEIWRPRGTFLVVFFDFFVDDRTLLPQLQKLSFLDCRVGDLEGDTEEEAEEEAHAEEILLNATESVTARWNIVAGCTQLQSFRLVSRGTRAPWYRQEDLRPFRQLKESGMNIYIGTKRRSVV